MGDEFSFTTVSYMNSVSRMVQIFAVYVLCTIFWSVVDIMLVDTVLNGEVAVLCRSLLPWLHCRGHGVVCT